MDLRLEVFRKSKSDMILLPDPKSARVDPICDVPTLTILCDIYDPITKKPLRDPRYVAKKAEAFLKSTGIADTSYWSLRWSFFSSTIYGSTKL